MNLPQTHCFFVLQISLTHDNGHLCRRSALQTLPLSAALLHEKVPLVSFLALRSLLKNTLIREMSIHARSCTLQADSGSQSVLFDESVQSDLMVLERQVQATIHFCSFLDGGTCHKNIGFCLADIPDS